MAFAWFFHVFPLKSAIPSGFGAEGAMVSEVIACRPKSARVEKLKEEDPEETRQMFDKRELRKCLGP